MVLVLSVSHYGSKIPNIVDGPTFGNIKPKSVKLNSLTVWKLAFFLFLSNLLLSFFHILLKDCLGSYLIK
jgi:hypothetical protein